MWRGWLGAVRFSESIQIASEEHGSPHLANSVPTTQQIRAESVFKRSLGAECSAVPIPAIPEYKVSLISENLPFVALPHFLWRSVHAMWKCAQMTCGCGPHGNIRLDATFLTNRGCTSALFRYAQCCETPGVLWELIYEETTNVGIFFFYFMEEESGSVSEHSWLVQGDWKKKWHLQPIIKNLWPTITRHTLTQWWGYDHVIQAL